MSLVQASDFIHESENAERLTLDGAEVVAIWAEPNVPGPDGMLIDKITIHIDIKDHADPEGVLVARWSPNAGNYTVETARRVCKNSMWKLELSKS